jgi:hypothetical protein
MQPKNMDQIQDALNMMEYGLHQVMPWVVSHPHLYGLQDVMNISVPTVKLI